LSFGSTNFVSRKLHYQMYYLKLAVMDIGWMLIDIKKARNINW